MNHLGEKAQLPGLDLGDQAGQKHGASQRKLRLLPDREIVIGPRLEVVDPEMLGTEELVTRPRL